MLLCSLTGTVRAADLDSLLSVLDEAIASHQIYDMRHEAQIDLLKKQLSTPSLPGMFRYRLQNELYMLYKAYACDSAICYLNRNVELADSMGYAAGSADSRIALSYLLSSSGMYMEAVDALSEVSRATLSEKQLIDYYMACDHTYGELGAYTQDTRSEARYTRMSQLYKDSIYMLANADSEVYLSMKEIALRDDGRFAEALAMNDARIERIRPDTPEYALVMYYRALIYREQDDMQNYMVCLALSAIADVRSAIKDHASLWMLAHALFDNGDIGHAYRYMDFSWAATKFYNARLRAWQSGDDLSLIDNTYRMMLEDNNHMLKFYIACISLLSTLLLLALFYIWRQMKKLAAARQKLLVFNTRLKELNEELQHANNTLQETNRKLSEANTIKEGYIARFIKLCSTYVDRLDAYRRLVHKKLKANQTAELLRISRSDSAMDDALEELYANFDSVFLHIFPDFVERFNDLLRDDERIVLRDGNRLTTELRIFALIRLGITDSSQIAEFLHYSPNTIYNYRAKVKNKARVSREDFEDLLMHIR